MAFLANSRNIQINGAILTAECQCLSDNSWRSSSLDLDLHIGNFKGTFSINHSGFSTFASNIMLSNGILSADLYSGRMHRSAIINEYLTNKITAHRSFNLNLYVANKEGVLTFVRPMESLLNSSSCFMLKGTVLNGLCIGTDGLLHWSSIDLNDYYGNDDASLVSGSGGFSSTSRKISLDLSGGSVVLKAECHEDFVDYGWASVDLTPCILVRQGSFVFERHDGPFDRDGVIAHTLERVPFAGLLVSFLHHHADNADHALRALALSGNSTIVCVGIMLCIMVSASIGAAIGAAATTGLGIFVESKVAAKIEDPQLRAQFAEATVGRYIYETLRNTAAAGAAAYLAEYLVATYAAHPQVLAQVSATFAARGIAVTTEPSSYALLKKYVVKPILLSIMLRSLALSQDNRRTER
ncbi:hypothetical protein DL93DRAFT_2061772 [Clavulina sp. PMI_390]|nr:hypothetical protein DL93DRAFT_2061772 [Clavulina sp. PMI_390]